MEAGTALSVRLHTHIPIRTANSNALFRTRFTLSSPSSFSAYSYRGPKPKRDFLADWVSQNDDAVRTLPIYVGSASLFAVLFNRALSGIAPVADAGSSQSRADLLTLGLAVTNILTGLVWLSIRPKSITVVNPQGVECKRLCNTLPDAALNELLWVWESISYVTCCRSLVIVYESICVLQIGFAAESSPGNGEAVSVDANKLMHGSVYRDVMKSIAQSYLANLSLYPGKSELPFLPSNTQGNRVRGTQGYKSRRYKACWRVSDPSRWHRWVVLLQQLLWFTEKVFRSFKGGVFCSKQPQKTRQRRDGERDKWWPTSTTTQPPTAAFRMCTARMGPRRISL